MSEMFRPEPTTFAIPAFVALMALEAWVLWRQRRPYAVADTAASLGVGIAFVVVQTFWKLVVLAIYAVVWQFRLFDLGTGPVAWLLLLFADDCAYYWEHRFHHEVRFMWASHVSHHSSQHYNLSTALRQSFTSPFTGFWFWLPLPLLGFRPWMVLTMQACNLLYQFWVHTELVGRLWRPVEFVMNTPSHHRVHHGSNPQYLDKNYAGIFIFWDRLFGTFEPEVEPVRYGLTKNIATYNPFRIGFHEWAAIVRDVAQATSWRHRLAFVVGRPGWRPDGAGTVGAPTSVTTSESAPAQASATAQASAAVSA